MYHFLLFIGTGLDSLVLGSWRPSIGIPLPCYILPSPRFSKQLPFGAWLIRLSQTLLLCKTEAG
jgi:hypothetical protein